MAKLGQKLAFLSYHPNTTSDFDEFWSKVAGYGLPSYGLVLYVGKTHNLEKTYLIPWRTIGLRKEGVQGGTPGVRSSGGYGK